MARYVLFMPIGLIGSTDLIGAICPNELMPIGPICSISPSGAICPIDANWAMQLVPLYVLTRLVLCMPIGPIGSTGPIGAICLNELLPIGPIGSIGPIGAICTIYAK